MKTINEESEEVESTNEFGEVPVKPKTPVLEEMGTPR